jgi:hypothetical protein
MSGRTRGYTETNSTLKTKKRKFDLDPETFETLKQQVYTCMELDLPCNHRIINFHSILSSKLRVEFNNSDYKSKVNKNFIQKNRTNSLFYFS